MIKIIVILVILAIVGGVAYYYLFPFLIPKNKNNPIDITVWGVVDDEGIMNNIITGYKKLHPNVNVVYTKQTLENFRTRVQAQVAVGQGADVIAVHNSWVPMFLQTQTISSAPTSVISKEEFNSLFYPVVKQTMSHNGNIYALPESIDGLILYYNKDILNAQGLGVPSTWDELVNVAVKTTVADQKNIIRTAGAPLGGYDNFPFWSETVGLLFMEQPDVSITAPANDSGREVVSFYNTPSGGNQASGPSKKIWDSQFGDAINSFSDGNLTFLFAPSSIASQIKRKNPKLNFATTTMPQLPSKTVNIACFWGYGVSSKSKNQEEAWKFVKFLTDTETEKYRYEQQSQKFGLGEAYSRVDMQGLQSKDSILGAVVNEAPTFKSFPLCSDTKDNGLNDDMIKAFKPAMQPGADLKALQTQIQQILTQYGAISFQQP